MKPISLYIHWPFCAKKCPYCDFNSHVREDVDQAAWREAMHVELRYWHARTSDFQLDTIFFGGGTPSLAPPETIAALIEAARGLWHCTPDLEITLEANPTSVEAANFAALARAGVNRISIGVQSFDDAALAFLGREHSADEARNALETAHTHFARSSFDLIYALPGQTPAQWQQSLRTALPFARGHLALYQLTIEPNTAFHHAYHARKTFALPPDDDAATMYDMTGDMLGEAGMPAYEISNYAAMGQECRHNLAYWRSTPYIGIGPGAHGRVDIQGQRIATATIKSPERWLEHVQKNSHGIEQHETLDTTACHEERVLMGLRMVQEGVLASLLPPQKTRALAAQGLLSAKGERVHVTPQGALLLDYITGELLVA